MTYELNTYDLRMVSLGPLLRLSQVSKGAFSSWYSKRFSFYDQWRYWYNQFLKFYITKFCIITLTLPMSWHNHVSGLESWSTLSNDWRTCNKVIIKGVDYLKNNTILPGPCEIHWILSPSTKKISIIFTCTINLFWNKCIYWTTEEKLTH